MKEVHLLKFKWLYNVCDNLESKDYNFIASALPTLRDNLYGLDTKQIERLDSVYEKYKKNRSTNEDRIHPSYNSSIGGYNLVSER